MEPASLRQSAHELGEAMGLLRDRLDKDLSLYAANLEKLAQAVELMEETLAAERRKRERRQAELNATPAAETGADTEAATEADTEADPAEGAEVAAEATGGV
jgi:hypothetical protein